MNVVLADALLSFSAWRMNVPSSKVAGGGRCSWARCQQLFFPFRRAGRVLQDRLCY